MVIVADTSPLNYLVLIGAVRVLPALYGRVTVPPEVLGELRHTDAPPAVRHWAAAPPEWLDVRTATTVDDTLPLDAGEKAAISLALELRADRLLIDERDGREVAARLGIPLAGTLAVLRDAAAAALLDLIHGPAGLVRFRVAWASTLARVFRRDEAHGQGYLPMPPVRRRFGQCLPDCESGRPSTCWPGRRSGRPRGSLRRF